MKRAHLAPWAAPPASFASRRHAGENVSSRKLEDALGLFFFSFFFFKSLSFSRNAWEETNACRLRAFSSYFHSIYARLARRQPYAQKSHHGHQFVLRRTRTPGKKKNTCKKKVGTGRLEMLCLSSCASLGLFVSVCARGEKSAYNPEKREAHALSGN